MFGFIVSLLVTLGAVLAVVLLIIARREELKRDPTEGMGAWELVNGKAWKATRDRDDFMDTTHNWLLGLVPFALASAVFTVVNGVMLWGR